MTNQRPEDPDETARWEAEKRLHEEIQRNAAEQKRREELERRDRERKGS